MILSINAKYIYIRFCYFLLFHNLFDFFSIKSIGKYKLYLSCFWKLSSKLKIFVLLQKVITYRKNTPYKNYYIHRSAQNKSSQVGITALLYNNYRCQVRGAPYWHWVGHCIIDLNLMINHCKRIRWTKILIGCDQLTLHGIDRCCQNLKFKR